MSKSLRNSIFFLFLCLVFVPVSSMGAKEPQLVGQEAPNFSLPSSQDTLVSYFNDYYGKFHLIMTFFPAAFTPT